jgi:hypothetical protein
MGWGTHVGPATARERCPRQEEGPELATHQPQVLHGLGVHALVQLQLAHFHDLHTSDRVASWEENPGGKQKATGEQSSLCRGRRGAMDRELTPPSGKHCGGGSQPPVPSALGKATRQA